jgi:addiction module RelB/DinJ family antitoxin
MLKTTIQIDAATKKRAQQIADGLGLPLSAIVDDFLQQFIRDKKLPKEKAYQMSPKLEKMLEKVEEDIKKGKNISGPFYTAEEMIRHLHANED